MSVDHPLLHAPLESFDEVQALVDARAPETQHLDFKRLLWSGDDRHFEAAKDVAALMNAEGGDIVIGVSEKKSRASGFSPEKCTEARVAEQVAQIAERLAPREAAGLVSYRVLEGGGHRVAVVTVAPWPSQPVAVRVQRSRLQGGDLCFPQRVGTHTRYLEWEEVMLRMDQRQALYLRLTGLVDGGVARVRIESQVLARLYADSAPQPLTLAVDHHGVLASFDRWRLELDLSDTTPGIVGFLHAQASAKGMTSRMPGGDSGEMALHLLRVPGLLNKFAEGAPEVPSKLIIPTSFVLDVWRDAGGVLALHLQPTVCLTHAGWKLFS